MNWLNNSTFRILIARLGVEVGVNTSARPEVEVYGMGILEFRSTRPRDIGLRAGRLIVSVL